jgi:uncharacterized protein (DUF433 family)
MSIGLSTLDMAEATTFSLFIPCRKFQFELLLNANVGANLWVRPLGLSQKIFFKKGAKKTMNNQDKLIERITINPKIFGVKPIIRVRRLAVEHVFAMLAFGDTPQDMLQGYPWLEF